MVESKLNTLLCRASFVKEVLTDLAALEYGVENAKNGRERAKF